MKRKRIERNLIGALAWCRGCDWVDEWYKTAQKSARAHAIKTGHIVDIEIVYTQTYNKKKDE